MSSTIDPKRAAETEDQSQLVATFTREASAPEATSVGTTTRFLAPTLG